MNIVSRISGLFRTGLIHKRLYSHVIIVALFLCIMISLSIWSNNTLIMMITITRYERNHTVSRVEAMNALLVYMEYGEIHHLETFYKKMAVTQSYSEVFSDLEYFLDTTSQEEFTRILEQTYTGIDHKKAVIVAKRLRTLRWHPIIKALVNFAKGGNLAGERIKLLVSQLLAESNKAKSRELFAKIEEAEKDMVYNETNFSRHCSDMASTVATFVDYISIFLLILTVGFTSLLMLLVGKAQLRESRKHSKELEKEIAERTLAEEALIQSSEMTKTILESPESISIFSIDEHLCYTSFNTHYKNKMKNLYGKDVEIGMPLTEVLGEDIDMVKGILTRALAGDHFSEIHQFGKDERYYDITFNPISDKGSGRVKGLAIFIIDVTEKIQLESLLVHAQKMDAIGTLAGGIAHDFNNILGGIVGYAQLASYEVTAESKLHEYIQQVIMASGRARELIKQILSFSRQIEWERKPMNVSILVKEVDKLMRASIPSTIDLEVDIRQPQLMTIGDSTRIHQVIMNLCTNAHQAMGEAPGTLTLRVDKADTLNEQQRLRLDLSDGEYIRLDVSDTGTGIPPQHMERIFDPYFTTKVKSEGTGLGLSVVHRIVRDHGGAIDVTSKPGDGTTFTVYLPLFDIHDEVVPVEPETLVTGRETVLFVDDETILVEIGQEFLEQLGYQVITAESPETALEIFQADPDRIDLLVTDFTMPKINGETLAREIHKTRPDLPVILCTGFSESLTRERAQSAGINAILLKPLSLEHFSGTIRRVFENKGSLIEWG